jgi:hypothetical protein
MLLLVAVPVPVGECLVMSVTGVYIAGVLLVWSPVAVLGMWWLSWHWGGLFLMSLYSVIFVTKMKPEIC